MLFFPKELDIIDRVQLAVSYLIRLALIFAIGEAIFFQNWTTLFVGAVVLLLTLTPSFIERNYKIHLPIELEFITVVFVYASIFLGEVHNYYVRFWWWDVVTHAMYGIAMGFAGFLILFILYHQKKIAASPIIVAIFSFCFALAIGAVWEIIEFGVDSLFGANMQKSGLVDTMWDLIVDAGGALAVSFIGYFYIKKGGGVAERIIRRFLMKNPQFK